MSVEPCKLTGGAVIDSVGCTAGELTIDDVCVVGAADCPTLESE